jgi:Tripartite tricarboxylate transporter TctB family
MTVSARRQGQAASVDRGRRLSLDPDTSISGVLLLVFLAGFLLARQWGFRATLVPSLVCGLGMGLTVLHLVFLQVRRKRAATATAPETTPEETQQISPDAEEVFTTAGAAAWRANLGWLACFFVLLYLIGLVPTVVLFTLAYLKVSAAASWRFAVCYAVGLGLVLWFLLVQVLAIPIPEGLFA